MDKGDIVEFPSRKTSNYGIVKEVGKVDVVVQILGSQKHELVKLSQFFEKDPSDISHDRQKQLKGRRLWVSMPASKVGRESRRRGRLAASRDSEQADRERSALATKNTMRRLKGMFKPGGESSDPEDPIAQMLKSKKEPEIRQSPLARQVHQVKTGTRTVPTHPALAAIMDD